ncbi:MAG: hypothetical protein WD080_09920 [Egibacteraceae bacterium]
MTHTTAVHALRLPLLATTVLAFALALALGFASPAAATTGEGFQPTGPGFVDPSPTTTAPAPAPAPGQSPVIDATPPTGGVSAGFGGMAADTDGLGAPHAVAAGLLALMTTGLAVRRRAVRAQAL